MPAAAVAAVATAGAGVYAANKSAKATQAAGDAQSAAAIAGIKENRRQFDLVQKLLEPFVNAGSSSIVAQQDLIGLNGTQKQQQAINALQNSPEMNSIMQQGENAILQNASATGGLRGGNVQAALGQFRPAVLAQLINDQYNRLGGLTSVGQNAAAGVGNAGMQTGSNVAALLQQQGSALAGSALGRGAAAASLANVVPSAIGVFQGLGGFGQPAGASTLSGTPSINNFG